MNIGRGYISGEIKASSIQTYLWIWLFTVIWMWIEGWWKIINE
jgi:hypothetical protein